MVLVESICHVQSRISVAVLHQLGGDGGGAPVGNGVDDWNLSVFVFGSGEREREREREK
jgi:hypothetical protein